MQPKVFQKPYLEFKRFPAIEILELEQVCMLAQVLQIFLGKEHLVKNRLISTLDKVIYFKGTIFQ
jgi:hypothetical protein